MGTTHGTEKYTISGDGAKELQDWEGKGRRCDEIDSFDLIKHGMSERVQCSAAQNSTVELATSSNYGRLNVEKKMWNELAGDKEINLKNEYEEMTREETSKECR